MKIPFIKLLRPELFQGEHAVPPYFEGWYYKLQTSDGRIMALIPGVSLSGENPHAFLQLLGCGGQSYLRFPLDSFSFSPEKLRIRIGENVFEKDGFRVKTDAVEADVKITEAVPYSRGKYHTGIMGPFTLMPLMECRHGVITVTGKPEGYIRTQEDPTDLSGGRCYIEKDWGCRFPGAYLWIHAFLDDASFMLSAARIPFLGHSFGGLLAFLYDGRRMYRFATYSGAFVKKLVFLPDGSVRLTVSAPGLVLRLAVRPSEEHSLLAPVNAGMGNPIREATSSELHLTLTRKDGSVLFVRSCGCASFENCRAEELAGNR